MTDTKTRSYSPGSRKYTADQAIKEAERMYSTIYSDSGLVELHKAQGLKTDYMVGVLAAMVGDLSFRLDICEKARMGEK